MHAEGVRSVLCLAEFDATNYFSEDTPGSDAKNDASTDQVRVYTKDDTMFHARAYCAFLNQVQTELCCRIQLIRRLMATVCRETRVAEGIPRGGDTALMTRRGRG